jgi:hypothetical protein
MVESDCFEFAGCFGGRADIAARARPQVGNSAEFRAGPDCLRDPVNPRGCSEGASLMGNQSAGAVAAGKKRPPTPWTNCATRAQAPSNTIMPRFSDVIARRRREVNPFAYSAGGAQMEMFLLGLMVAFTPTLLILAWTLWDVPDNH